MQAITVVLPTGELEFPAHVWHAKDPFVLLNVPSPHCAQGPPAGPEKPAMHKHVALPLAEVVLSGQGLQSVPAVLFENVLAPHARQDELSTVYLK